MSEMLKHKLSQLSATCPEHQKVRLELKPAKGTGLGSRCPGSEGGQRGMIIVFIVFIPYPWGLNFMSICSFYPINNTIE